MVNTTEWISPAEYGANLRTLLDMYPAPTKVLVFPWKWNGSLTDPTFNTEQPNAARRHEYLEQAQQVARERGARLVDLGHTFHAPLSHGSTPLPDYLVDRLIHASAHGHEIVAELVAAAARGTAAA